MDDLVQWLREQIATDVERWRPVLPGARLNGKATAREHLARCEAHTALINACLIGVDPRDPAPFGSVRADLADDALWFLACAYRHRPGFRDEWRPPTSPEMTE